MGSTPASWSIQPDQLIPVINLAREVSALWILPAVFYSLCMATPHSVRSLARGVTFRDQTTHLDPADLEIFLEGSYEQRESASAMLQFLWHPEVIPGCLAPARCYAARCSERKYREGSLFVLGHRPLELWGAEEWRQLPRTICSTCVGVMKMTHKRAIASFWADLPTKYRLPCWEDLEQMKDAALC